MATLYGVQQMYEEAARFAALLHPLPDRATIIALSGELGSGKTTFTQGVAKALGIGEMITSPTFVIEKIYELSPTLGRGFTRLIHIDTYRIRGEKEMQAIGWHEITKVPENLILLEWPEQIGGALPADSLRVTFKGSGDSREVHIANEQTKRPA